MFLLRRRRVVYAASLVACLAALVWLVPRAILWAQTSAEAVPACTHQLRPSQLFQPHCHVSRQESDLGREPGRRQRVGHRQIEHDSQCHQQDTCRRRAPGSGAGHEQRGPRRVRVYVADPVENGITILKVTASSASNVTAVVEVPLLVTGAEPWNVVATPDGSRVFVANSGRDQSQSCAPIRVHPLL